jgi:curved DNA-binding protein
MPTIKEGSPSAMRNQRTADYYEILQVSPNAEAETIQRLYRLLAQRFHPDNRESGSEERFRELSEAHAVLSDPQKRAQYDVAYHRDRQERWRLVSSGGEVEDNFALEQMFRLTLLEALYARRKIAPEAPTLYTLDLVTMIGRPREHLEFTVWYLLQKHFISRDDQSRLTITAEGVDHLEQNYRANARHRQLPEHRQSA